MKIIIAGYGLIGKAITDVLKTKHEIVVIDPQVSSTEFKNHHDADGCIICVNTTNTETGGYQISEVFNVLNSVPIFIPVMIKSTIPPASVDEINSLYPDHSIVISPDFSRTRSATADFQNQKYIILGGEDPECFWQDLFQESLPNCNMVFSCSDKEAALIKYASNGFLAIKTSYFNQLYDICTASGLDFDIVRQILTHDPRIGHDHSMVPGPDAQRGWGGINLIRDTDEFVKWAELIDAPIDILKIANEYNQKVRKNY